MDINGWPRHQLRAQGRLRSDPRIGYRKAGMSAATAPAELKPHRVARINSAVRSSQLLNFLAKTASDAEKALLQPALVPDFALVRNSLKAEFDVNDLAARKRKNTVPEVAIGSITVAPEAAAEGLLGKLADSIADVALHTATDTVEQPATRISLAAEIEQLSRLSELPDVIGPTLKGDCVSFSANSADVTSRSTNTVDSSCSSASALELNEWFSCTFDSTDGDFDLEFVPEAPRAVALLPAALPPVLPRVDDTFEMPTIDDSLKSSGTKKRVGKSRRNRSKLFQRLVINQPRIAGLPGGERLERFDNGAELKKDALGRVRHIRSGLGVSIAIAYDNEGQPQSFVRSDRHGQMHSIGERDTHGVVVRDLEGRVRAAGELMCVDPSGCLSLRRVDGQFWSLDLVKELHIERRSIIGRSGDWNFLTAVFTSDGFRMMTRFQRLSAEDGPANDRFHWLASEPTGTFRFYGRDGSVIEFEGEDHLTAGKPQHVWAPGSRCVDFVFRGQHQAGTAWDSVQEYVTSYLSA